MPSNLRFHRFVGNTPSFEGLGAVLSAEWILERVYLEADGGRRHAAEISTPFMLYIVC